MTQKLLCLSAALLFAFAAMNVASAEEAVVTPTDCPCAKAAGPCQCGPVCQCGSVCDCNMCCPPVRCYRVGFPRIIRPVYYAPAYRPVYYMPRFYRVPYCGVPAYCW